VVVQVVPLDSGHRCFHPWIGIVAVPSFRMEGPSHSRMIPNHSVRPVLPPWDTVGGRISGPEPSPSLFMLAAETEAAETQTAPDVIVAGLCAAT